MKGGGGGSWHDWSDTAQLAWIVRIDSLTRCEMTSRPRQSASSMQNLFHNILNIQWFDSSITHQSFSFLDLTVLAMILKRFCRKAINQGNE